MKLEFETKIKDVNAHDIVQVPPDVSEKLPSRGMVMVEGVVDGQDFIGALEPDGEFSHWFELEPSILKKLNKTALHSFSITAIDEWHAPVISRDILEILGMEGVLAEWDNVTVKAKWDWLRWIRFTKNPETRERRIKIMCSKLKNGDKRPCCFDRTRCTVTDVSRSGKLDLNL